MLTAQQFHKHSLALFTQIQNTDAYDQLKNLLFEWRDSPKSAPQSIAIFLKVINLIISQTPQLLDDLNRCLAKDYNPSESTPSLDRVRKLAIDNANSIPILDSVLSWLRTEQPIPAPAPTNKSQQIEELSEGEFFGRLQRHERCREIAKIIYLYRRCIINLKQFKSILEPIYFTDISFFNMLYQYAEELQSKRRKVTIFNALNELVDQRYPVEQIGNSYILIPDGYANWGKSWATNPLESALNRLCVSVPLGTQGNFLITRKNQFEQQLLRNQQEKYEIDSNVLCLQAAVRIIQKTRRLTHPLVQKVLANIYTNEVVGIMMRNPHPEVARSIVVPRLKQKLAQLQRCRAKFQKTCQQVASKNFYKSLDYRCFYFCKNDKKFNCPARWQKEIELRRKEVLQEKAEGSTPQIEDRQSLQHSRHYVLNSFDNITTQQIIPERRVDFEKRQVGFHPKFPNNQVLFLLDFGDSNLLNDVLEVVLFHTQKKALLQLLVFKTMKLSIQRKLQKYIGLLSNIEGKQMDIQAQSVESLNQPRYTKRVFKDLTVQFFELIEEDIQPAKVSSLDFPFEGPQQHTFIGTKQCYFFLRYLITIYQRFARAKTLAEEKSKQDSTLYSQFLAVIIHKVKQQKGFQQYLRKIFQQDAFIFFTLDKLILGLSKLINNISTDSLTYNILKDGVRDYELQIRKWEDYPHATVTEQLSRLYKEPEILFRFTYSTQEKLIYISAWDNGTQSDKKKKEEELQNQKNIFSFLNSSVETKETKSHYQTLKFCQSEYFQDESGSLTMLGEQSLALKRKGVNLLNWDRQFSRFKRLKLF